MCRNSVREKEENGQMNEENRKLEEIRLEMQEIRKMLHEIKEDTKFFKQFMERYHIPMQEEVKREAEIKDETNRRGKVNEIEPKL